MLFKKYPTPKNAVVLHCCTELIALWQYSVMQQTDYKPVLTPKSHCFADEGGIVISDSTRGSFHLSKQLSWSANTTAAVKKARQRLGSQAHRGNTGCSLPLLEFIVTTRYLSKAGNSRDFCHPGHHLLELLVDVTDQRKQALADCGTVSPICAQLKC